MLLLLIHHPTQIFTGEEIAEQAWHHDFCTQSNVLDVFIRYLRRKIDAPHDLKLIHTVRRRGYFIKRPDHVLNTAHCASASSHATSTLITCILWYAGWHPIPPTSAGQKVRFDSTFVEVQISALLTTTA